MFPHGDDKISAYAPEYSVPRRPPFPQIPRMFESPHRQDGPRLSVGLLIRTTPSIVRNGPNAEQSMDPWPRTTSRAAPIRSGQMVYQSSVLIRASERGSSLCRSFSVQIISDRPCPQNWQCSQSDSGRKTPLRMRRLGIRWVWLENETSSSWRGKQLNSRPTDCPCGTNFRRPWLERQERSSGPVNCS